MPGTISHFTLFSGIILTVILGGQHDDDPQFKDQDAETPRAQVTHPRSGSQGWQSLNTSSSTLLFIMPCCLPVILRVL